MKERAVITFPTLLKELEGNELAARCVFNEICDCGGWGRPGHTATLSLAGMADPGREAIEAIIAGARNSALTPPKQPSGASQPKTATPKETKKPKPKANPASGKTKKKKAR